MNKTGKFRLITLIIIILLSSIAALSCFIYGIITPINQHYSNLEISVLYFVATIIAIIMFVIISFGVQLIFIIKNL